MLDENLSPHYSQNHGDHGVHREKIYGIGVFGSAEQPNKLVPDVLIVLFINFFTTKASVVVMFSVVNYPG